MNNVKLTNYLVVLLTTLVITFGGYLYTQLASASSQVAVVSERVAKLEAQSPDMLRRLDRIEAKLDALLLIR